MHIDLYSERRRLEGQSAAGQVYQYDTVPTKLRVQIVQIAHAALGPSVRGTATWISDSERGRSYQIWAELHAMLCREYGVHTLANHPNPQLDLLTFFELSASDAQAIDILELLARCISTVVARFNEFERFNHGIVQDAASAIAEINHRLDRAGCGYQFEGNGLIRVDSRVIHATVVQPILRLLTAPALAAVDQEYRQAQKHYRNGDFEDALVNALKAFESSLAIVCRHKGWAVPEKPTVKALLDTVMENGLIPAAVGGEMNALRATLDQGIGTIRNRLGGHGQGTSVRKVPEHVVAYALHLTASSILLVAKAAGLG